MHNNICFRDLSTQSYCTQHVLFCGMLPINDDVLILLPICFTMVHSYEDQGLLLFSIVLTILHASLHSVMLSDGA